jgi:hypothetical protein
MGRFRAINTIRRRFRAARPLIYAVPRKELYCHKYLTALLETMLGERYCEFRDPLAGCWMRTEIFPRYPFFCCRALGLMPLASESSLPRRIKGVYK